MPRPGSRRSQPKCSAECAVLGLLAGLLAGPAWAAGPARAAETAAPLPPARVVGDAIPAPLTGRPGDPARGRAIVTNRQTGLCLLCHTGPFPEARSAGDLGPDLGSVGSRWTEGQLRLRLVDASRLNPATVMPPYYRIEGLTRVAAPWRNKPILSAEQIEDVVAFLATLKDENHGGPDRP